MAPQQLVDLRGLIRAKGLKVAEETLETRNDKPVTLFKLGFSKAICTIRVDMDKPSFVFRMIYKERVIEPLRPVMAMCILKLNSQFKTGAFDLDFQDGELVFRAAHRSFVSGSCLSTLTQVWEMFLSTYSDYDDLVDKVAAVTAEALSDKGNEPNEEDIPEPVKKCILNDLCTAAHTRKSYVTQYRADCVTCKLTGNLGICLSCIKFCHKGHKIENVQLTQQFYCDCGMSTTSKCKCMPAGSPSSPAASKSPPASDGPGLLAKLLLAMMLEEQQEEESKGMDMTISGTFKGKIGEAFLINPKSVTFTLARGEKVKLGSGSFGTVYAGTLSGMFPAAIKAIKITQQGDYEMFKKEALMMKNLHHESIVTFYGITKIDRDICIVTQLCNQGSLESYIKTKKPTQTQCIAIAMQAAYVLEFVHQKGIVHRDIKLANFLMHDNKLKLADFGLTVMHHELGKDIGGTLLYMAPELMRGQAHTNKIDVYAFGIVMWELLHPGKQAFPDAAMSSVNTFKLAVTGGIRPEITRGMNSTLSALMESCWNEDSKRRPSFLEIYQTLSLFKATNEKNCLIM